MFSGCLRFVDDKGVTDRELERIARTKTNLNGMQRWGYIRIDAEHVIRPTAKGRTAKAIWESLFPLIEARWEARFGKAAVDELRSALAAPLRSLDLALPQCMPILGYGMRARTCGKRTGPEGPPGTLAALLANVLLAFTLDFERDVNLSLAIGANVLRLLGEEPVRVRDLPRRAAVSKEAIAMALRFLDRRGDVRIATESAGGRVKVVALTPEGLKLRSSYEKRLGEIENGWRETFGATVIDRLRRALEQIVENAGAHSKLLLGTQPHPEGWRAAAPPQTLPDYPMVLHRGGFPDGS
jgi:DNA-binding MarR family transcriptional regulator